MREEKIEREEPDPTDADAEEELPLHRDDEGLEIERQAPDVEDVEREDPLIDDRREADYFPDVP